MSLSAGSGPRIVHVARQAILDARGHVVGYELLYTGRIHDAGGDDADVAGARLLADAVLDLRLETITDGRTAFIDLTRSLLLNGAATLLRPGVAVFELRNDIGVDHEVVAACSSLSTAGYRLALDGFMPGAPAEALLPFISYVKADVATLPPSQMGDLAQRLTARGIPLIAQNVETREAFASAHDAGCTLFQGYFFCQPETRSGSALAAHVAHLRLLSALNQPRLTMDELEELVKQDAVLSVRVLQCINSAAFAIRREVRSIREALVLLGMAPIRKWASVWCLAKLNLGGTSELATTALLRARSCELLAADVPGVDANEMFLVGLCSVLDAMLGKSMAEAVATLPLSEEARAALAGTPNALRSVLDAVISYERGDWSHVVRDDSTVGEDFVSNAYVNALIWARELSQVNLSP